MTRRPTSNDVDDDELFRTLAASGDRQIRNLLVERHTGLAVHIAQRFPSGRSNEDDLRQVADSLPRRPIEWTRSTLPSVTAAVPTASGRSQRWTTPTPPTISITIERTPDNWLIQVGDVGDHFELSDNPSLPSRFERTGRGLFVVRSLVDDVEIVETATSRVIRCRRTATN